MATTATAHDELVIGSTTAAGHRQVLVAGALTVGNCWRLREVLDAALHAGLATVTIDLRNVEHLDAAGLVAVSAPAMRLRRRGTAITILLPQSPAARRVADMAGIAPLLNSPAR